MTGKTLYWCSFVAAMAFTPLASASSPTGAAGESLPALPASTPILQAIISRIDTSGLGLSSSPRLSEESLRYDAGLDLAASRALEIFTAEEVQSLTSIRSWDEAETEHFTYRTNPLSGQFFMARKEGAMPSPRRRSRQITEKALEREALDAIRRVGIPDGEIGDVFQRTLLKQTREGMDRSEPPKIHAYKTFVRRAIGNVPVLGSQLVVTFDAGGNFRKLIGRWPTLSSNGHRLSTSLSREEIAARVAAKLSNSPEEIHDGRIPLSFVFVPRVDQFGEARLSLSVEALLESERGSESKIRVLLVDLDR